MEQERHRTPSGKRKDSTAGGDPVHGRLVQARRSIRLLNFSALTLVKIQMPLEKKKLICKKDFR